MATEVAAGSPAWARPYRSGRLWAVVVTVLLALTVLYFLVLIVIITFPDPFYATFDQNALDWVVRFGDLPLLVLAAVSFLAWFARAYRNLPALGGQNLQWSPRSAVLWWFVPLANLFMPYRIMAEIWKVSSEGRHALAGRVLLLAWWLTWLAAQIFGNATRNTDQNWVGYLAALLGIAAIALALTVMWMVQLRQNALGDPRVQPAAPFPGPA
ncbi:MAG: DUF4328 domain-containing protein [Candidatus Dormibacteraeota bacterium]|nr:DUF4328 domain-containing protein [Candidatus Dormibacteraeota bacterium]